MRQRVTGELSRHRFTDRGTLISMCGVRSEPSSPTRSTRSHFVFVSAPPFAAFPTRHQLAAVGGFCRGYGGTAPGSSFGSEIRTFSLRRLPLWLCHGRILLGPMLLPQRPRKVAVGRRARRSATGFPDRSCRPIGTIAAGRLGRLVQLLRHARELMRSNVRRRRHRRRCQRGCLNFRCRVVDPAGAAGRIGQVPRHRSDLDAAVERDRGRG